MGQARLDEVLLFGLVVVALSGQPAVAEKSRFMSYDSERDCSSGGILSAAVCHSAFANARAEFEAKTGSFPSRPACAKVYGSCAAWPPGSNNAKTSYRPEWGGVDIVDTPSEKSVTPAVARGAKRLTFAARSLTGPDESERELLVRGARRLPPGSAPPSGPQHGLRAGGEPGPAILPGKPGGGFTLQNGVLTFPAPARFAPNALPKPP